MTLPVVSGVVIGIGACAHQSAVPLNPAGDRYGVDGVDVTLDPPEGNTDDQGNFRPTVLMAKASKALADEGPMSKTALRKATGGKTEAASLGIDRLIEEGFARYGDEVGRGGGRQIEHVKDFTHET